MEQKSGTDPHGLTRRAFATGLAALATMPALAGGMGHRRLAEAARGLAPEGLSLLAPQGSEANLNVIAALFRDISGIEIRIETTGIQSVANDLMLRHLSGKAQWDVALPATNELPDLIAAGAIRPMPEEPLRDPDDRAVYRHGDVFDGQRYGYFTDGDQQMIFFNREIQAKPAIANAWEDQTGRSMGLPESWAEFDAQLRHVTNPDEDRWGGLINRGPGFVENEFWLRLLAKGVWPLDVDLVPQIDGDAGVEALLEMIDLQNALAPPATGPGSLLTNARKFEEGRVLCFLSYGGLQKILNRSGGPLAGHLDVMVPPGGGDPELPRAVPAMTWGWSYTVPARTQYAEAAKLLSAFAVSAMPSTAAVRVATGFFDPFLDVHYTDPEIESVYGSRFLKVHRDAMNESIPDFYVARRGDYMATLARWLGLALNGSVPPRIALESAANDWNLLTSTIDRNQQLIRWRSIRAAFPPEIASRLRDTSPRTSQTEQTIEGSPG